MDVNQLKDNIRKIKTSVWCKNILDTRMLIDLKENAPLYVDGAGLTNNQKIENEYPSMNYYPKTAYWRPLVPNDESVGKTTNPYFKNLRDQYVVEK